MGGSKKEAERERVSRQTAFLANPFKLSKQLLGQKRSGHFTCSRDTINNHLRCTYNDPNKRNQPLGQCKALITPPEPTSDFNLKELSLSEVEEVVRRARAGSVPGPSGVPYKV